MCFQISLVQMLKRRYAEIESCSLVKAVDISQNALLCVERDNIALAVTSTPRVVIFGVKSVRIGVRERPTDVRS